MISSQTFKLAKFFQYTIDLGGGFSVSIAKRNVCKKYLPKLESPARQSTRQIDKQRTESLRPGN